MTNRRAFFAAMWLEARAGWRPGGGAGAALGFFVAAAAFVSMALGPALASAGEVAPAMVWVLALVAAMFAAHGAFDEDNDKGIVAVALAAEAPLAWLMAGKIAGRWLAAPAPLALAAPFAAFWLDLGVAEAARTALGLVCAGPALAALGLAGAALTSGLGAGPALTGLLTFPLHAPALALGVRLATAPGLDGAALVALLALSAVSAALCPWLVAAVLRRAP